MQFPFCLLMLATLVISEKTKFKLAVQFNDKDLFQDSAVGTFASTGTIKCALHCVRTSSCSMFSFNKTAHACQLYGDGVYPSLSLVLDKPGTTYYGITGWCPLKDRFFVLRSVNMCAMVSMERVMYPQASQRCGEFGARLITLEDENKTTALLEWLANLGLNSMKFTVGVTDSTTEGVFVWSDGRQMIRDWWDAQQPNDYNNQDCVVLYEEKLRDVSCDKNQRFICEIPN